jgi:hypothetical protein
MDAATIVLYIIYALWNGVFNAHLMRIGQGPLHQLSGAERWFKQRRTSLSALAWRVPLMCRVNDVAFLGFVCWRCGWEPAAWLLGGGLVAGVFVGGVLAVVKPLGERSLWLQVVVGVLGSASYPLTLLFAVAAWVALVF